MIETQIALKTAVPVLHMLAYAVYIVSVLRGRTQPYPKLWFAMLLMAVANAASYVAVSSLAVAPQYIAGVVATLLVLMASLVKADGSHLHYSYSNCRAGNPWWSWVFPWIYVVLGAVVLALVMGLTWFVATRLGALVQIVLALLLIPMVIKVITDQFDPRKPSEWYSWALWTVAGAGTWALVWLRYGLVWHMGYLMPTVLTLISAVLTIVAWRRRHTQPQRAASAW